MRLVSDEGHPIGSKAEARRRADEILRPHRLTTEAERLAALAARADRARVMADAASPGVTLAETWDTYLAAGNRPDTGAATLRQYRCQWDNFAEWMREQHPDAKHLADVTPALAQAFIRQLETTRRSPRTVNGYANLLHLIFRILTVPGKLHVNPWAPEYVTRRTLPKDTGRKELSVEQLRAVCEAATGEIRTLLAVGLYTGLRLGDAVRLTWEEIDLARGVVVVTPRKTARTSGATVAIPIVPAFRRVLDELHGRRRGPIVPTLAARYESGPRGVIGDIQRHFAACGLETSADVPGRSRVRVVYGFHSLRHSFISHAAAAGWPESLVRAIVGHTSASVTRRYLHMNVIAASTLPALPDVLAPQASALPAPPADWRERFLAAIRSASTPTEARVAVAALPG